MSFLDALASSIATAEGYFVTGSLSFNLSNPGDLMYAGQPYAAPHPVTGKDGKVRTFAQFARQTQGIVALYRQILVRVAQGASLRKLICDPVVGWAPDADGNNSSNYLTETLRRLASVGVTVDPDAPLWQYLGVQRIS